VVLFDDEGRRMRLTGIVGSGGVGTVYHTDRDGIVAKVVTPAGRHDQFEAVMRVITDGLKDIPFVCRPRSLLRERPRGEAVGYSMPFVKSVPLTEAKFPTPWHRKRFAINGLRAFNLMFEAGLVYSDGHEENLRQNEETGDPEFIDVDSISALKTVDHEGKPLEFHFRRGVHEWLPPEATVLGDRFEANQYALRHTAYMFAWYVLKGGKHPALLRDLDGRDQPLTSYVQNLEFGRFAEKVPTRMVVVDEGLPWAELPAEVRGLFRAAFSVRGLRDALNRPEIDALIAELTAWAEADEREAARLRGRRKWWTVGGLASAAAVGGLALTLTTQPTPNAVPRKDTGLPKTINQERPAIWRALEGSK
jgi:DNA-binding helix-hairpin-helix protein with protein kinase domain